MTERYNPQDDTIFAPAKNAAAVTPSDSATFSNPSKGLYVGGAGNVAVTMVGGDTVTFSSVPAGSTLPICASKVLSTGTTATNIVRVW